MTMTRNDLVAQLHISLQDDLTHIYEKLFCAALLTEGSDVTARVLTEYNFLKGVLKGETP
jgi:hypothetical protein